ncbi:phage GP46 family protein [Methylobacter tundripaludum]|uniref:phage GP46 family protein n=1 Tax=Methylobacter tundripaludum TaxID=173365 RepID=UPI0004DFBC42|nr:phage GP46 family protein [Methylobacter tundripaludum]
MSDIKTVFIGFDQGADYVINSLGLVEDDGLETSVILSLFTDRRANADDVIPDGSNDRRGWWADQFADINNDQFGSRLWLLSREKQLTVVLIRAKQYADEALKWMVDDGVAESVEVVASNPRMGILGLLVAITRPGQSVKQFRFESFWSA